MFALIVFPFEEAICGQDHQIARAEPKLCWRIRAEKRKDAERDCLSAIAFALEGDPRDYDTDAETLTFDVNVAPAA